MGRLQFADEGDSLHIWMIIVNVLNKQVWTANKGLTSSLRVGHEDDDTSL
jgi:hypothetical protein